MNTSSHRSDKYCKTFEPVGFVVAVLGALGVMFGLSPNSTGLMSLVGIGLVSLGFCILRSAHHSKPFKTTFSSEDILALTFLQGLSLAGICLCFQPTEESTPLVILGTMMLGWFMYFKIKLLSLAGGRMGDWIQSRWPHRFA